ncbi:hypothetical protein VIGAN_01342600 [Vigna angularis var. angularis]|uniref:U-box domain-containing protein n=1 Tax=Vigna angularis var. angularis TaxID=157739 RepID=A0A0S3R4N6_PHAAN|nr:hypothetical protein VIGAN_01342600 [Vigna angularis var. angularis]
MKKEEAKFGFVNKEKGYPRDLKKAVVSYVETALASLIAISAPKWNKLKLVSLGAVRALSRLLAEAELGATMMEKVLKLVEAVSSTREMQKEISEDTTCVTAVLRKVLKLCGDEACC